MRQIKFRAKTTANGHWVYGSLIDYGGNTFSIRNKKSNPWVQPETIGQFTVLTDSAGKEIYEGNKVRFYNDIEDELVSSHVIYHKESCSFCVAPNKLCGDYIGITAYWQFEIIGNIYDHPELIPNRQRYDKE